MFYKDFLDYDVQLFQQGKAEGIEETIRIAINNNAPMSIIKAIAEASNIPQSRINQLLQEATV